MPDADLPLRYATPPEWAADVLRRPLELLNDHAHLEKKAAANALELLNRYPEPNPPENWVTAMTAIARDEVEHLAVVCRLLARRGGRLSLFAPSRSPPCVHRTDRRIALTLRLRLPFPPRFGSTWAGRRSNYR